MDSCFRIFKLVNESNEVWLKEAYLIDTDVFKYQNERGDFATYDEARSWLKGLSALKGQYVIAEVFTKG